MTDTPIHALHVFGTLSRTGGAEKWVLDMLARRDPRVRFDFLLSVDDDPIVREVRELGSTVHVVPFSRSPMPRPRLNRYLAGVRDVLRKRRYDVVHVHQFDLSGEILRIAAEQGVTGRVMSVHATEYDNPRFHRRCAHHLWGRPWIFQYATHILPCSRTVGISFVPEGRIGPKVEVLYTGIEPSPFRHAAERRATTRPTLLREFGIPAGATVVGHIGRFTRQKNHAFLIELLSELMRSDEQMYAVLLGQGELLDPMRRRVADEELESRILLPGPRGDVPDMLASLFDVSVLPSLYEGLPIVGIESLGVGLGLVMSDRISDELNPYFPGRVVQLPLEAASARWKDALATMTAARIETHRALAELARTPFTIAASLERLIRIYRADTEKTRSEDRAR